MELLHPCKKFNLSSEKEMNRLLKPWKLKKQNISKKRNRELTFISPTEDQEEMKKIKMSPNTLSQRRILSHMTLELNNLPNSISSHLSTQTSSKRSLSNTCKDNKSPQKLTKRNTKSSSNTRHQPATSRIRTTKSLSASESLKLMRIKFVLSSPSLVVNKTNIDKLLMT
jgi:cellobiose phosphorylase